jgi:hypothetical protein
MHGLIAQPHYWSPECGHDQFKLELIMEQQQATDGNQSGIGISQVDMRISTFELRSRD